MVAAKFQPTRKSRGGDSSVGSSSYDSYKVSEGGEGIVGHINVIIGKEHPLPSDVGENQ